MNSQTSRTIGPHHSKEKHDVIARLFREHGRLPDISYITYIYIYIFVCSAVAGSKRPWSVKLKCVSHFCASFDVLPSGTNVLRCPSEKYLGAAD